jgi:LPXTG-motif cell wall-anchored protein
MMRSLHPRAAALAAAALLPLAVPAPVHAAELPGEPVLMHLKGHPELSLAWTGERAELAAEGDTWSFTPVEALRDLGSHLIVHEETGRCLSAAPATDGADTAPVTLADCADATRWTVVFDDVPAHEDYRFTTPEGRHLGIEDSAEAVEGAEVLLVDTEASRHEQEWRFEAPPPEPEPSTPPPAEETTPEPVPPAEPKLPQTGSGVAALGGAGLAAVAAGAVMLMWWRRRTLRGQW